MARLQRELVERVSHALPHDGSLVALAGLQLNRASAPTGQLHGSTRPSLCVIAQGSKEIRAGTTVHRYDANRYLIASTDIPVIGQVTAASVEQPYLALRVDLDATLIGSVLVDAGHVAERQSAGVTAIAVSTLTPELLDAVVRLVRLIDSPHDAGVLAPLVKREIVYRLLRGNQGARLQQVLASGSMHTSIGAAIERLRQHFDEPLRIEAVAQDLGMSVSSFHQHFKAVTAMSPLQFQKHLRLQEARRLMVGEGLDAASAGYQVGYLNPSHFNREYKRFFGNPPMRDVISLREGAMGAAEA